MKTVSALIKINLLLILLWGCEPGNTNSEDHPSNPETKLVLGPTMKKGAIIGETYFFYSSDDSVYSLTGDKLINITPSEGMIGSPADMKVYLNYLILATTSGNLYQYNISEKTWLAKTGLGDIYSTTYFLNFRPTDNKLFVTSPGIEYSSGNFTWTLDFPMDATTKPTRFEIKLSNGKTFSTPRNFYIGPTNMVMMGRTTDAEFYVIFQEHGNEPQFALISEETRYFKLLPFANDKFIGNNGIISRTNWYKSSLFDFTENMEWVVENEKIVISSKNSNLYQFSIVEKISGFSISGKKAIVSDKKVNFLAGDATQIVYQDKNTKQIYKQIIVK